MNNKRTFEREIMHIQPPQNDNISARRNEHACEEKAVQMGIVTDRTYATVPSPLSTVTDADHVWLFVPARTSKRSLQNLAETCGSHMVRFYVRVRCLINYIFSDMDVAYQLNDDGRYYMLTVKSQFLSENQALAQKNQEYFDYQQKKSHV